MNIRINNLTKDYGTNRVLEIDELEIGEGSLMGIIGPNGAGKSTLVKIIAGLEEPSIGEIYYNQMRLKELHYRQMTLVFQKPYLTRTTVFNDIAYPLVIRKEKKENIRREVNGILEEMGLMEFRDKKTCTLSGGEMQKVALARALIFKPSLLMLDEPTANIDPSSIAIMERIIKKMNDEHKTTVIMITHNLYQTKRLCKEVVFLNKGKVVEYGDTEKVILEPQRPVTKAFIQGELLI